MRLAAPRMPGPLVAVALAIALSIFLHLANKGVALVGEIATGLPTVVLPDPMAMASEEYALSAIGLFVVSFTSGIVTARSFATRNRYRIDADRELIGFGVANIAAGLFGGFAVTGADSRTAINDTLGGKTQIAGLVAAASLALSLLFLTGLLVHLPLAALGAVLASAAVDLFDYRAMIRIWRIDRIEFVFALIAILGVVMFGVLAGIIVAVFATLLWLVGTAARPRDALLGRIPGVDGFYKLHWHAEAKSIPGVVIYLVQGPIIFFNCDRVRNRIRWIVDRMPAETRHFILDANACNLLDSTGAIALSEIAADLAHRGISLSVAELHHRPRILLERAGFFDQIGRDHVFSHLEHAARAMAPEAEAGGRESNPHRQTTR
jgi:MFS superfamily sulfate permease-like transporter